MKKIILHLFILVLIFICKYSYGQLTFASIDGFSNSRDLTLTNPVGNFSETRKVGLCYGKIGNDAEACFYSYDITKMPDDCLPNDDYVDDTTSVAMSYVVYIVYNYYPGKNPGAGQLTNLNTEAAAIQSAIWHYTNGLNVNTISNTATKNRALAIIAATNANGASWSVPMVLRIVPDADPDLFYVQTTSDNGAGISVSNISLSITPFGSLSQSTVNTNASGISPPVEVLGANSGTLTAIANNIPIPKGTLFRHISNDCPKIILACNGPGKLKATADWGALPVELTSFVYSVNGRDVTLSWSTSSEINNSGFEIEKSLVNNEWNKIGFVNGNGTSSNQNNYSFTDRNAGSGRFNYRMKQIDYNGNFEYFNLNSEVNIGVPSVFNLNQNYPNPFNPSTKINYDIAADGFVTLKIYNTSGKEIATLVNGFTNSGYYTVSFDATSISSGIYYYKLEGNGFSKVMKMALVK